MGSNWSLKSNFICRTNRPFCAFKKFPNSNENFLIDSLVGEVDALMRSIVSCDKQSHNCVRPLSHYCHPVLSLQQSIAAQKFIVSSLMLHVMQMRKERKQCWSFKLISTKLSLTIKPRPSHHIIFIMWPLHLHVTQESYLSKHLREFCCQISCLVWSFTSFVKITE